MLIYLIIFILFGGKKEGIFADLKIVACVWVSSSGGFGVFTGLMKLNNGNRTASVECIDIWLVMKSDADLLHINEWTSLHLRPTVHEVEIETVWFRIMIVN